MIKISSRSRLVAAASPLAVATVLARQARPGRRQTRRRPSRSPRPGGQDTAAQSSSAERRSDQARSWSPVSARRSQNAINKKKKADQIVESVSAEDIGKLPDSGIGESIARLPGISAQRHAGRANIISIRGFGPDFSTTLLNGREQTTTNDSRAVEYDQYPSEISPRSTSTRRRRPTTSRAASLAPSTCVPSSARCGQADHRGRRSRHLRRSKAQPEIEGRRRPRFRDLRRPVRRRQRRPRDFGGLYQRAVPDARLERVGLQPAEQRARRPPSKSTASRCGTRGRGTLKRLGLNGTVQARVSDDLMMTWDGFYSNFKDHVNQNGVEFQVNQLRPRLLVENGLVKSWQLRSHVLAMVEGYTQGPRRRSLLGSDGTPSTSGHNGWLGMVDLSWSRTDRTERQSPDDRRNGFQPQRCQRPTIAFDWTKQGPGIQVPVAAIDYLGSEPARPDRQLKVGAGTCVQAGYDNLRKTRDDIKQARAEIERELGGFFEFGRSGEVH